MKRTIYDGKNIILLQLVGRKVGQMSNQNLLVISNGMTVGDKDFSIPREADFKKYGYVLAMFFKRECVSLTMANEELAEYVNNQKNCFSKVFFYGCGIAGLVFYNALALIDRPVTLVGVSIPFGGCFWANHWRVRKMLWRNYSFFGKLFKWWHYWISTRTYSKTPFDSEIVIGSKYLNATKKLEIPSFHVFVNVVTHTYSVERELRRRNFTDAVYAFLNKLARYKNGNGIFSVISQTVVHGRAISIHANYKDSFDKGRIVLNMYV